MNLDELTAEAYAVYLAKQMLSKKMSFFEGAARMAPLRHDIDGLEYTDEDFLVFVLISSETDHLPLKVHHHLWDVEALKALDPDFKRVEEWAETFAVNACKNIIERFSEK